MLSFHQIVFTKIFSDTFSNLLQEVLVIKFYSIHITVHMTLFSLKSWILLAVVLRLAARVSVPCLLLAHHLPALPLQPALPWLTWSTNMKCFC